MPDLELITADGPLRVFTLLHAAQPVLLKLGHPGCLDITPWADRVQLISAEYAGAWELPGIGVVAAPTAVLIRPDGYVAWVGDRTDMGLADALTTWFGPACCSIVRGFSRDLDDRDVAGRHVRAALGQGLPSRPAWHHDRYTPDSCRLAASPKLAEVGHNRTKKDEDLGAPESPPSVSIFSLSAKFAYDPHSDSSALPAGQVKRQVTPEGA
jgi:hypothetical protein